MFEYVHELKVRERETGLEKETDRERDRESDRDRNGERQKQGERKKDSAHERVRLAACTHTCMVH